MTNKKQFDSTIDRARPNTGLAIVIGAGGISSVVARRLGETNRLLIADINVQKLSQLVGVLQAEGAQAEGFVCDITDLNAVARLAERAKELGGFCKLAHVAGLSPSLADWRTIVSVNLIGPSFVLNALEPLAGPGIAAVLVASLAAHISPPVDKAMAVLSHPTSASILDDLNTVMEQKMTPQLAYVLSKQALLRLVQSRSVQWGLKGARISSLSPGLIDSPQGRGEFKSSISKASLLERCPLRRQGDMQEIADAMEFLLSERATYIKSVDLLVDGGIKAALQIATSPSVD